MVSCTLTFQVPTSRLHSNTVRSSESRTRREALNSPLNTIVHSYETRLSGLLWITSFFVPSHSVHQEEYSIAVLRWIHYPLVSLLHLSLALALCLSVSVYFSLSLSLESQLPASPLNLLFPKHWSDPVKTDHPHLSTKTLLVLNL